VLFSDASLCHSPLLGSPKLSHYGLSYDEAPCLRGELAFVYASKPELGSPSRSHFQGHLRAYHLRANWTGAYAPSPNHSTTLPSSSGEPSFVLPWLSTRCVLLGEIVRLATQPLVLVRGPVHQGRDVHWALARVERHFSGEDGIILEVRQSVRICV
jgi:hypothetical protein